MVGDIKDAKDWTLGRNLTQIIDGGARPDPRNDPKNDLLRGQQPPPSQQPPKDPQNSTAQQLLTSTGKTPPPQTQPQASATPMAPRPTGPEARTQPPVQMQEPDAAARQAGGDAFLQMKLAATGLDKLGQRVIQPQPTLAGQTPPKAGDALQQAMIAKFLPSKETQPDAKTDKPKLPVAKDDKRLPEDRVATDDGKRVRGKTDTPEADAQHSATVAQYSGPFLAQPRSEARRTDEQTKEIETDRAAEVGLQTLAGGDGAKGVARAQYANREFSKGYHTVSYGEDDTDALAGRPGAVSARAVALDGSSARDMALRLQFSSQILKTPNDRPPVGVLVARTTDDVSGSQRGYDVDMALNSRIGLYGGIIG